MNSNVGQSGLESIRLDGRKIEELPMGQGNEAKDGLKEFLKTDKQNRIDGIKAKYPTQNAPFLKGAIRECEHNISKIKKFKVELKSNIDEYRILIKNCDIREREISQYNKDNPEDKEAMKALRLKYPPYDVDALNKQIEQFEEGISRCDDIIEQDYDSIAEVKGVLALVEQRDRELLNVQ